MRVSICAIVGKTRTERDAVRTPNPRHHIADVPNVAMRAALAPRLRIVESATEANLDLEIDGAFETLDPPREFAPRKDSGKTAVERIGHASATGRGRIDVFENVTFGAILPLDGKRPGGRYCKMTALVCIEDSVEEGRAIHIWHAPPIDRAICGDESDAAPITERGVTVEGQLSRYAFDRGTHGT
jgi:hypothetical protein